VDGIFLAELNALRNKVMFPELLHDDVDDSVEDLADRCLHAIRRAWTASRLSCVQEGILLATAMFQNADVIRCMDVTYLSEGIIRLCVVPSDGLPYKVKVKLKNLIDSLFDAVSPDMFKASALATFYREYVDEAGIEIDEALEDVLEQLA
jgi:hypothetical protein